MQWNETIWFNNSMTFGELKGLLDTGTDSEEVLNAFKQRIEDLYLTPARLLCEKLNEQYNERNKAGYSFALGLICLCTIDALARYKYCGARTGSRFKKWLIKYIGIEEDDANCLYNKFRNGLVHEARIKGGCFLCEGEQSAQLLQREGEYVEVDPVILWKKVCKGFEKYIEELRKDNEKRQKLIDKLKEDFNAELTTRQEKDKESE